MLPAPFLRKLERVSLSLVIPLFLGLVSIPPANPRASQATWAHSCITSHCSCVDGWKEEFGRRKRRLVVSKEGKDLGSLSMASSSKQMRDQQGILPSSACKSETKVSQPGVWSYPRLRVWGLLLLTAPERGESIGGQKLKIGKGQQKNQHATALKGSSVPCECDTMFFSSEGSRGQERDFDVSPLRMTILKFQKTHLDYLGLTSSNV